MKGCALLMLGLMLMASPVQSKRETNLRKAFKDGSLVSGKMETMIDLTDLGELLIEQVQQEGEKGTFTVKRTVQGGVTTTHTVEIDLGPNAAGDTFENVKAGASTVAKANGQATGTIDLYKGVIDLNSEIAAKVATQVDANWKPAENAVLKAKLKVSAAALAKMNAAWNKDSGLTAEGKISGGAAVKATLKAEHPYLGAKISANAGVDGSAFFKYSGGDITLGAGLTAGIGADFEVTIGFGSIFKDFWQYCNGSPDDAADAKAYIESKGFGPSLGADMSGQISMNQGDTGDVSDPGF
jgi:hypothetical protein